MLNKSKNYEIFWNNTYNSFSVHINQAININIEDKNVITSVLNSDNKVDLNCEEVVEELESSPQ